MIRFHGAFLDQSTLPDPSSSLTGNQGRALPPQELGELFSFFCASDECFHVDLVPKLGVTILAPNRHIVKLVPK
jgi:hypothetical protein